MDLLRHSIRPKGRDKVHCLIQRSTNKERSGWQYQDNVVPFYIASPSTLLRPKVAIDGVTKG